MTPDEQLMADIRTKYGRFIDAAVAATPFPAALLAALTANETGLNEQASRFEPGPLGQICLVLVGQAKKPFGAITQAMLRGYLPNSFTGEQIALALVNLATSWGPTQIMGYQALAGGYPLGELTNLNTHFVHTVAMLTDFQTRFRLTPPDPSIAIDARMGDYFRCWNAGSPTGKTFDPDYAQNGLTRMAIYLMGSSPA